MAIFYHNWLLAAYGSLWYNVRVSLSLRKRTEENMDFTAAAWIWLYIGAFLMLAEIVSPGFVIFSRVCHFVGSLQRGTHK